jgi:DNA-binding GntR family transcriptional regulator
MTTRPQPSRPRYVELADALQQAIACGTYAVGDLLPTESDLCAEYAVSRHTAREALRALTDLGLVSRRQGSGTQVIARTPATSYRQALASLDDLLQYAAKTRLALEPCGTVAARGDLARLLDCAPGREWSYYRGLRRAPRGRPICTTEVYIEPRLSGVEADFGQGEAIYRLIERRYGEEAREVLQEITAISLPDDVAAELDADAGSPALKIIRRYIGHGGRAFEISISIHPADRFTYSLRLRRHADDGLPDV